jgi:hypothetical protein
VEWAFSHFSVAREVLILTLVLQLVVSQISLWEDGTVVQLSKDDRTKIGLEANSFTVAPGFVDSVVTVLQDPQARETAEGECITALNKKRQLVSLLECDSGVGYGDCNEPLQTRLVNEVSIASEILQSTDGTCPGARTSFVVHSSFDTILTDRITVCNGCCPAARHGLGGPTPGGLGEPPVWCGHADKGMCNNCRPYNRRPLKIDGTLTRVTG